MNTTNSLLSVSSFLVFASTLLVSGSPAFADIVWESSHSAEVNDNTIDQTVTRNMTNGDWLSPADSVLPGGEAHSTVDIEAQGGGYVYRHNAVSLGFTNDNEGEDLYDVADVSSLFVFDVTDPVEYTVSGMFSGQVDSISAGDSVAMSVRIANISDNANRGEVYWEFESYNSFMSSFEFEHRVDGIIDESATTSDLLGGPTGILTQGKYLFGTNVFLSDYGGDGSAFGQASFTLNLRPYTASVVPEPGTVWMTLGSMAMLGAITSRKIRRTLAAT